MNFFKKFSELITIDFKKKNFFFRRSPIKYNTSNVNSDGDPIYKEAINKGFRSPRITAINDKPFIAGGVECEGYK